MTLHRSRHPPRDRGRSDAVRHGLVYGTGHSELVRDKGSGGERERVAIATWFGFTCDEGTASFEDGRPSADLLAKLAAIRKM
jgi:membrane carboxypeptidase/penicillin-binding protein PbpC